jgi:hypothetical protein
MGPDLETVRTEVEKHVGSHPETNMIRKLLRDKRAITLDLALMVAGTKNRGQFEERIKVVMDEIRRSKNAKRRWALARSSATDRTRRCATRFWANQTGV